ncbi:MAG: T9SS type A sorting domain-containing protein [Bacteroidota bacterium]
MQKAIPIVISGLLLLGLTFTFLRPTEEAPRMTLLEKSYDKQSRLDLNIPKRSPDGIMEFHNTIRTKIGEEFPNYPNSYKAIELQKAKSRLASMRTEETEEDLPWIERGPGNVGGRTRIVIPDPENPQSIWFAAGVAGGIWKTEDAGITWRNLTPTLPNMAITDIVQVESNPDIMYASTGEGMFLISQATAGNGIYKSTDRGETWELLPSTMGTRDFRNISRIIVNPDDENHVLAATGGGINQPAFFAAIMRSFDGGETWEKVYQPRNYPHQIIADPTDFNKLYVSVYRSGMVRSTDGGDTWQSSPLEATVTSQFTEGRLGRTEFAIAPSNPNRLYASVEVFANGSRSGLFTSDDAGQTWSVMEANAQVTTDYLGGQGVYDNTITVSPFDENKVFWGGVDLFRAIADPTDFRQGPREFLGGFEENISSFMDFTFVEGFTLWGGRVESLNIDEARSVEIRFGAGRSQMAHRFIACGGNSGAGCADPSYEYQDYVEVPFEVWDLENNIQLNVSFRDQQVDGEFNLNPRNDATDPDLLTTREYIYVHSTEYNASEPSSAIATNGGIAVDQMYFFWPVGTTGNTWDPDNLPDSKLSLLFGQVGFQGADFREITDAYRRYPNAVGNNLNQIHPDHHYLTTVVLDEAAEEYRLITTNDGGVGYSDDEGITFREVDNGYNTSQFYGVSRHPSENIYVGGTQDNGSWLSQSSDPIAASRYRAVQGGDGFEALWNWSNENQILVTSQFNGIGRSTNGGESFSRVTRFGGDNTSPFLSRLTNSRINPDAVYAITSEGLWRSPNFGQDWFQSRIQDERFFISSSLDVEASQASDKIVWAGTAMAGRSSGSEGRIFVSTDGGVNFFATNNYTVNGFANSISALESHPVQPNTAYALFSQAEDTKILRTEDLGQTWEDISGFDGATTSSRGFPDVAVHSLLVLPGDTLWAGTEIGIVESPDNGETWYLADNGLPNVPVWQMVVTPDGEVVVATHGRGIWTAAIGVEYPDPIADEEEEEEEEEEEPEEPLGLFDSESAESFSVYPNPASTQITAELPEGTSYEVRLFDLQGKSLKSWSNQAGGAVRLELPSLPIGTYVLRANDGETLYAQKVIIR